MISPSIPAHILEESGQLCLAHRVECLGSAFTDAARFQRMPSMPLSYGLDVEATFLLLSPGKQCHRAIGIDGDECSPTALSAPAPGLAAR